MCVSVCTKGSRKPLDRFGSPLVFPFYKGAKTFSFKLYNCKWEGGFSPTPPHQEP